MGLEENVLAEDELGARSGHPRLIPAVRYLDWISRQSHTHPLQIPYNRMRLLSYILVKNSPQPAIHSAVRISESDVRHCNRSSKVCSSSYNSTVCQPNHNQLVLHPLALRLVSSTVSMSIFVSTFSTIQSITHCRCT